MVMKKILKSQAIIVISDSDKANVFPPGFAYVLDGVIYTVRENVTKDVGSEMRKIITSEGTTEIVAIETITKDLRERGCTVISDGKINQKKVAKKRVSKKKTTEKKKNDGK